jgi:hypothetical protein
MHGTVRNFRLLPTIAHRLDTLHGTGVVAGGSVRLPSNNPRNNVSYVSGEESWRKTDGKIEFGAQF